MRAHDEGDGFAVQAIAGSYVILLGIDATPEAAAGLLGFAIRRRDVKRHRTDWLEGMRTFEETAPHPEPGQVFSTRQQPVQAFLWGDYTVKPGRRYTYTVIPLTGTPSALVEGPERTVDVTTEAEEEGTHAVWFNRGVAASQAYSRKFGDLTPDRWEAIHQSDEVVDGHHRGDGHGPRDVWVWLSRGLEEAMLAFIGRADGPRFGLRAAVYEFNHPDVLRAFAEARDVHGADVRIVFDARADDPGRTSYQAMAANGLISGVDPLDPARPDFPSPSPGEPSPEILVRGRRTNPSFLSHNKFVVLLEDGEPVEVWTGSTNVTTGGIFGQSNVGHVVRDPVVARAYLEYWERLFADPPASELRTEDLTATPDPTGLPSTGVTPVFSPRPTRSSAGRTVLDWYADRMAEARQVVCFTAAFGVNQVLRDVLTQDVGFLRYVLLESRNEQEMQVIGKDRDNLIAYGALIDKDTYGQWLGEQLLRDSSGQDVNVHVKYVHTKYMIVDPLTDDPIVISGSANFSDASTEKNDENMLVIRGDQRVADIYLGEFMRLFHHLYFRDLIEKVSQGTNSYLKPDDSWTQPYFDPDTDRFKERVLFSGRQEAVAPEGPAPPPS